MITGLLSVSILYRPVKKKKGALYEIEQYEGVEPWDEDKWWEVGMDFHFGCFFFFIRLYKGLVKGTLNSLKNQAEISPNIKSILEESGEAIQQLSNLQEKDILKFDEVTRRPLRRMFVISCISI